MGVIVKFSSIDQLSVEGLVCLNEGRPKPMACRKRERLRLVVIQLVFSGDGVAK